MPFLCKSYLVGGEIVEQLILFESFEEAVVWAKKHARVSKSLGAGWDKDYHVDIYELSFGLPFVDAFHPGNPIQVFRP
jgi:hypothetical protein